MATPDLDRYATDAVLADGQTVHIRPVRPDDNDRMVEMWNRFSPETIRMRFFAPRNMTPQQMQFFSHVDYTDRFALAAAVPVSAEMEVDFAREKMAIFQQAWSYLRDHFYDERFHGADWNAVRARYAPHAAGARTPDELRRILQLMVGELNASHLGVNPPPGTATPSTGRLGLAWDAAEYERSGRLRVVGPGRGEWLSMLAERGVQAYGVEASAQMTRVLRARGVPVVHADAVAHLQELEPGSLDVVTGFHVVEHLELESLLELLTAARTALRPGGLLILETPNPMNLVMAACNFRLDPTHLQPLPPALTEFLVAAAGFRDVQVRMLHPKEPADLTRLRLPGVDDSTAALVAQALTKAFFGPQDYAVLARTPAHPAPQSQPG